MANKGGRPKGAAVPQKERMIGYVDAIYQEMQGLRERLAHFEKVIDDKNLQIKQLKTSAAGNARDVIHELLTPSMAYGMLIREMRHESGLTGAELARKLFVSTSQLSKMEKGDPLTNINTIKMSYEKMREMKQRGELKK